jgi:hypothetical protein
MLLVVAILVAVAWQDEISRAKFLLKGSYDVVLLGS